MAEKELFRIICYLRRSRQDIQRERKTGEDTLATQRKLMINSLDGIGIPYDIVEEIGSGDKIETRPVFQQVLEFLRNDTYNAVAVKELARLGRGSLASMGVIYDLLVEKEFAIVTPYKIYRITDSGDAMMIRLTLVIAHEELLMTKERLYSAKLVLAAEGRWMSTMPYGYKINSASTKLEFDEDGDPSPATIVQWIYDFYVHGILQPDGSFQEVGYRAVASLLNQKSIPSPRKARNGWQPGTIRRILTNPAYIGTVMYRRTRRIKNKYLERPEEEKIVVENAHEPIIDHGLWEVAQNQLLGRHVPHTKQQYLPCELASLVVCTNCGRKMVRQSSKQKYHRVDGGVNFYHKEFLSCQTKGCTYVKYRDVEVSILTGLKSLAELDVKELKAYYEAPARKRVVIDTEKHYDNQKRSLEGRLEFVYEKYEQGVYTDEVFLARKRVIEEALANLRRPEAPEPVGDIKAAVVKFRSKVVNMLDCYEHSDKTARNKFLRSVIDVVRLTKTGKGTFDLEILPRLEV